MQNNDGFTRNIVSSDWCQSSAYTEESIKSKLICCGQGKAVTEFTGIPAAAITAYIAMDNIATLTINSQTIVAPVGTPIEQNDVVGKEAVGTLRTELTGATTHINITVESGTFNTNEILKIGIPAGTPEYKSCFKCKSGRSQNQDRTTVATCTICELNKFAATGAATCTDCANKQWSDLGAATCELCPAGYIMVGRLNGILQEEPAVCEECKIGLYIGSSGETTCKDCPIGYFQNKVKYQYCYECPVGRWQGEVGKASCIECLEGEYRAGSDTDATTCDSCPTGYHQSEVGQGSW